jgi:hypothetical protein
VTAKSDIRRWNNAKGEGTLFSVDLLDEQGSEIRGTFFKELVDKFYTMLDTGRVFLFSGPWATHYALSSLEDSMPGIAPKLTCDITLCVPMRVSPGGRLKVAQKQYTSLKNDYEITFDNTTTITQVEDEGKIQVAHYNFKQVRTLPLFSTPRATCQSPAPLLLPPHLPPFLHFPLTQKRSTSWRPWTPVRWWTWWASSSPSPPTPPSAPRRAGTRPSATSSSSTPAVRPPPPFTPLVFS